MVNRDLPDDQFIIYLMLWFHNWGLGYAGD